MAYDFNRPFISIEKLDSYVTTDKETALRFGKQVKAVIFSNVDYKTRFNKMKKEHKMKSPPSCGRIFSGYLVVRKLGLKDQYETWMPEFAFEDIYKKQH